MKKGQVLLIVVMILATVLTVTLTTTYQSVTETQLTKLEEENQKALAAAEAGIEKVLQSKQAGNFVSLGLSNLVGINASQSSAIISNQRSNNFITPLLQKDEQYTLYLSDYDPQSKTLSSSSAAQDIHICFGSNSFNPALEITLIKSNSIIKRYAVNPQGQSIIQNANSSFSSETNCPSNNPSFTNRYLIPSSEIGNNTQLLIVRIISNQSGSTRVGFTATRNPFPLQGTTIISTARTQTGVEKKVRLFQSYPQIPSEFFVTSF